MFGRASGTARGTFSFSNGNRTVTLTPDAPFSAGELVFVNLSHDVRAADASVLRAAGYAFQFTIATAASASTFEQIDVFSNRTTLGAQTRIYGAAATDLNDDGYLDLATVNEVSADVRVFLSSADASGLFEDMLPREPIGVEASPNEPADFDNDGRTDLCTAAATSGVVNVLLGAGDGTFSSNQEIEVAAARRQAAVRQGPPDLLVDQGPGDDEGRVRHADEGETYDLCIYEDGLLVQSHAIPGGGLCAGVACWKEQRKGWTYRDRLLTPDGISSARLAEGLEGKATVKITGKGGALDLVDLDGLTGTLQAQLQKRSDDTCWGATFSPPFRKNDGVTLIALSDPPPPPPSPLWSAIHAQVIAAPAGGCVGCHGFAGGLDLAGCDAAYAHLVDVASTEHGSMDRVEPGEPSLSWLMHKLDGTHAWFTAECAGMACGQRMPLGGPYLPAATRDAIRQWIANGAVDDCP